MAEKECLRCIHKEVCKTAESCDGFVSGCKHFREDTKKVRMDMKEKLVELLHSGCRCSAVVGDGYDCWDCPNHSSENPCDEFAATADMLIANGVTVQEWISVEDRLPNCKKVIDGETYFKNVAVRVKGCGFEKIAFYDDEEKYWFDTNFFPAVGEVTHWCELPEWNSPQPPKGE